VVAYRLTTAAAFGLIACVVASPLAAVLAPESTTPGYAVSCGRLSSAECDATLRTAATAGYLAALSAPSRCGRWYEYSGAALAAYALAGDINRIGLASFNLAFTQVALLSETALIRACAGAASAIPSAIKRK
jgi:hypothetical protein